MTIYFHRRGEFRYFEKVDMSVKIKVAYLIRHTLRDDFGFYHSYRHDDKIRDKSKPTSKLKWL